jgi:flagellum-specific ATP synthase
MNDSVAGFSWTRCAGRVEGARTICGFGRVAQVIGLVIEGDGPRCAIGDLCLIRPEGGSPPVQAEVVGFRDRKTLLMPYGEMRGLCPGSRIEPLGRPNRVRVGKGLLGRVLDGLGEPIDGKGPLIAEEAYPLYAKPSHPLQRQRISEPVDVGVRTINALLAFGKGQRMTIFAGSGVGKSTLLGMMARHTAARVSVIALIGERGREVREFIEKDLGEEGLKRSVVVVATSDQHPLVRIRGAYLATTVAEYFRDQGDDILLMMDSITRFAMASREVGLAIGEPPTSKGYTPSVFAQLPKLLERAGTTPDGGSITGIYTVLVEGDDLTEPVADAVRSIADGHVVLARDLANQGHYPSIDVLGSISRVMGDVADQEQMAARARFVSLLAAYRKAEDLINIGAYVSGSNLQIDEAIRKMPEINAFLRQEVDERVTFADASRRLKALVK